LSAALHPRWTILPISPSSVSVTASFPPIRTRLLSRERLKINSGKQKQNESDNKKNPKTFHGNDPFYVLDRSRSSIFLLNRLSPSVKPQPRWAANVSAGQILNRLQYICVGSRQR
jgi:CRISPR/Cas system-associated protein Cas5 (RAMP superfamily)